MAMLRWAYTDDLELSGDDGFLIDLMKLANRFQLNLLRERWERSFRIIIDWMDLWLMLQLYIS